MPPKSLKEASIYHHFLTLYSALKEGKSAAPKPNPFKTHVKEILDTVGTGEKPSTRSEGANCLTVEGDMSWENLEISDGTLDILCVIIRDWELLLKLAIDLRTRKQKKRLKDLPFTCHLQIG